jgi:hypothetical protein
VGDQKMRRLAPGSVVSCSLSVAKDRRRTRI